MILKALLLFHFRAGIRLALQSFVPVFCAALALIMLDVNPVGAARNLALEIFRESPDRGTVLFIAVLAFLFALSAAPRLAHGANGWVRHLAFTDRANRRGLTLALLAVQLALVIALGVLALIAHWAGVSVIRPIVLRLLLVFVAAALCATPVTRRWASVSLSLAGAALAFYGTLTLMIPAAVLLILADASAGRIRPVKQVKRWGPATTLFDIRIVWRAVGWRILAPLLGSLIPLFVCWLFTVNNAPPAALSSGAARLGGSLAVVLFLGGSALRLSVRRPVWPWARSLPWSAARRALSDAVILGGQTLPLAVLASIISPGAGLAVVAATPFLSLRAAAYVRQIADRRATLGGFLVEGVITSAFVCLVPWTALGFLAAAPFALRAATSAEMHLKATRWSERHHAAAGDPFSWSAS